MVNMGNVWDRTAEFLSDNLASVMPVALLAIFVPTSIMSNLWGLVQDAPLNGKILLLCGIVLLLLPYVWGRVALTALALELPNASNSGRLALRRLPAIIVAFLALGCLALLAIMPISLLMVAGGVDPATFRAGEPIALAPAYGGAIALYGLLLFVAILWCSAKLALIAPVIVAEDRWFGAIPRSWRLTRGATFKIVGVLILYDVVASVSSLAAQLVFGSVFKLVVGRGDGGVSLASVLTTIVVGVVQTGFVVVAAVFVAQLYRALNPDTAGGSA